MLASDRLTDASLLFSLTEAIPFMCDVTVQRRTALTHPNSPVYWETETRASYYNTFVINPTCMKAIMLIILSELCQKGVY